jgi:magnesium transporter
MEETREKIELFRNYYLVCFRSFDQDPYSQTHLEPLNMYIIVFREGTLSVRPPLSPLPPPPPASALPPSILETDGVLFACWGGEQFHFRGTPHPQNVRRRIKQLKDYISVTSDWISYALIDDITDAFGPLIQSIEYEVDSIDELVYVPKLWTLPLLLAATKLTSFIACFLVIKLDLEGSGAERHVKKVRFASLLSALMIAIG